MSMHTYICLESIEHVYACRRVSILSAGFLYFNSYRCVFLFDNVKMYAQVKLALMLALIGGVPRTDVSGSRTRKCNVCILVHVFVCVWVFAGLPVCVCVCL